MQNAKDTFYLMLRDRIAARNAARTVLVRGALRPGVVVEENELAASFAPQDAFRLRWTETALDPVGPLPLVRQRCEIVYATAGNAGNGGMDRGRMLATMDAELAEALCQPAPRTPKLLHAAGAAATVTGTTVFWSDAVFAPATINGELLERTATVDVYSYQEEGER